MAWTTPAIPQNWQTVTQPNGYKVARVAMTGAATGVAITCNGATPVIAASLALAPRRNPAQLVLRSGSATANLGVAHVGSGDIWAAEVRDRRVLDMLASGQSVTLSVDGVDYGRGSLAGASAAMAAALGGCWRPPMAGTPTTGVQPGRDATPAPMAFGDTPMAVADTSSPETVQTSFPTRDPKTGKPRLPVKLGAYVLAAANCARMTEKEDRFFVDVEKGVGRGDKGAQNTIGKVRVLGSNRYAITEDVGFNGDEDLTSLYTVTDPEHFQVTSPKGKPRNYKFCPQSTLPIRYRQFLASEARRVSALPIRAGYYYFFDSEEPNDKAKECDERCGYALITARGMVASYRTTYSDNPRAIARGEWLFARIMQTAPFNYVTYGPKGNDNYGLTFLITGSDNFESPADGEASTTHYRRVDPSRIPPAMMPRF